MENTLKGKLDDLRRRIRKMDSVLVTFSGGVDSSFLMRICREELGEKAVAVLARAENYPKSELTLAKRVAKIMGIRHITLPGPEMDAAPVRKSERRYQSADFHSSLKGLAMRLKIKNVINSCHLDDLIYRGDYYLAAREAGVRSPLLESELTKAEIRVLAKELGLPNWDKPFSLGRKAGCRAKKLPVSSTTREIKTYLASLGMTHVAIRIRGNNLTIVAKNHEMVELARHFKKILNKAHSMGICEVFLKLA